MSVNFAPNNPSKVFFPTLLLQILTLDYQKYIASSAKIKATTKLNRPERVKDLVLAILYKYTLDDNGLIDTSKGITTVNKQQRSVRGRERSQFGNWIELKWISISISLADTVGRKWMKCTTLIGSWKCLVKKKPSCLELSLQSMEHWLLLLLSEVWPAIDAVRRYLCPQRDDGNAWGLRGGIGEEAVEQRGGKPARKKDCDPHSQLRPGLVSLSFLFH